MSTSSSDNLSTTAEPVLSPAELSRLIAEPDMLYSISTTFASKPTTTAILRYYAFLSRSINQLELDLDRHQLELQAMFLHLMETRSFQTKIRPIVHEYRRKIRSRFHPYSRTSNPPTPPSTNNSPSTDNEIQGRVSVEIHNRYDNPHYTALDDALGSKEHPIIVTDDEKKECEGCRGDHEFRGCAPIPQPHSLKVQESRKPRQILSPAYN
jgi:hypothetical protein